MKRVLVCDDDKNVRFLMTFALTAIGWEVVTSEDCKNIIEKVVEHQPSIIIMDNIIPDVGGIITTQTLKSNPISKNIPVILCSSTTNLADIAAEAGADCHIAKPIDIKKLGLLVNECYDRFLINNSGQAPSEISDLA